ncbi:MAG: bifunctional phosphoserine phosphatase/homoserine phosphotransferase ThrH [Proteobacteria bacterium]|nr:bifunctional phosphoserine phosphatase/homoserine phosphotransferase ThrH [Pseudomonadota bacterium]
MDMEGVIVPEIWPAVAARTGVDALTLTTRDVPVYTDLMDHRLKALADNDISLSTITGIISTLDLLDGAKAFLDELRMRYQVAIISDTFYEFAGPFMRKLGWPTLLCHRLQIENDRITDYRIRQPDPKRCSIKAFKSLNFNVYAAGDSYNDVTMLEEADAGFLFRAPDGVKKEFPQYASTDDYAELIAMFDAQATNG